MWVTHHFKILHTKLKSVFFLQCRKQASGPAARPVKLLAGGGSWARLVPRISTAPHIVPEVTPSEPHEIQRGLQRLEPWDRLQK